MNALRKGHTIVLDSHPCVVTHIDRSAPGKHGHAKYNVFGKSLLNGKTKNDLFNHRDKPIPVEVVSKNFMGTGVDSKDDRVTFFDEEASCERDLMWTGDSPTTDTFTVTVRYLKWLDNSDERVVEVKDD